MKVVSEKAALILVSLVVVLGVAFLAVSIASEGRRKAALEGLPKPEAIAKYQQLSQALAHQQAPPDTANGDTNGRLSSDQEVDWTAKSAETIAGYQRLFDILDGLREGQSDSWDGPFDKLSSTDRTAVLTFLDGNHGFIEEIRRMAQEEGPAYPLDLSRLPVIDTPHHVQFRLLTRLLGLDAVMQAQQGNAAVAVQDLLAGLRLADTLANEPLISSQMERGRLTAIVNGRLQEAFPPGKFPAEDLERLVSALSQSDNRQGLASGFGMEREAGLAIFEGMHDGVNTSDLPLLFYTTVGRPLLNNDEATYIDYARQFEEVAGQPYYEAKPTIVRLEQEVRNLSWTRVLSRSLTPVSGFIVASHMQAEYETIADLMQLGLLVEQYYVDNGAYPESLNAVASRLGGVPLDPFSGKPYAYTPSANGFLLYGLGWNQTDDSGRHDPRDGDIVWRGRQGAE